MDARRGHGKRVTTPSWSGGKRTERVDIHRMPMDGQKIFDSAPWHQRHWYESTITLVCNGANLDQWKQEKISNHDENSHESSTRTRTTEFLHPEERDNEAKTIRLSSASRIRMDESKLEKLFLATFFFIIFTTMVGTRTSRHSMERTQDTSWRDHNWWKVMAADS